MYLVEFALLESYDILPLQKYLADNGVNFVAITTVIDMDFENVDNKKSVKTLRILQGDEEKFVEVGKDDLVFFTNGSITPSHQIPFSAFTPRKPP